MAFFMYMDNFISIYKIFFIIYNRHLILYIYNFIKNKKPLESCDFLNFTFLQRKNLIILKFYIRRV